MFLHTHCMSRENRGHFFSDQEAVNHNGFRKGVILPSNISGCSGDNVIYFILIKYELECKSHKVMLKNRKKSPKNQSLFFLCVSHLSSLFVLMQPSIISFTSGIATLSKLPGFTPCTHKKKSSEDEEPFSGWITHMHGHTVHTCAVVKPLIFVQENISICTCSFLLINLFFRIGK